jgi:hypothetical protein
MLDLGRRFRTVLRLEPLEDRVVPATAWVDSVAESTISETGGTSLVTLRRDGDLSQGLTVS